MRGRRLSRVQQLGLEILLILDQQDRDQQRDEAMRLALLTTNPSLARGIYPRYFDSSDEIVEEITDESGEIPLNTPGTDFDFRGVEFEAPQENSGEWDMLTRMLGDSSVTVSTPLAPTEGVNNNLRLSGEPDDGEWI